MTECTHCIVSGRVQGVSYRVLTRRKATELGLAGWVRNLPDGTVEVYAQGGPEAVAALREWLRAGPPGAKVAELRCRAAVATEGMSGFEVRR
ncbi:MAG: acylphosphatase [Gammaproteobacteria bacterium]|jgi:acylphosphatase|nr:acylphosphatase [Gammaproteobacteria bacterium]